MKHRSHMVARTGIFYTVLFSGILTIANVKRGDIDVRSYTATAAVATVFVHRKPGDKDSVFAVLKKGQKVRVVGMNGDWKRVRFAQSRVGYIQASKLRRSG